MQTRQDMCDEFLSRMQVAVNSTLYPADRIVALAKQANIWATQLFTWDELEHAKKTSTKASRNYYSQPVNMRTATIKKLYIDGKRYDRKSYEDFEDYLAKNPNAQKKIFALHGRFIFVNPTPTITGDKNLWVWGQVQVYPPYDLANATDKTIFSLFNDEGNEAIVKKMLSIAKKPSDPAGAVSEENEAIAILTKLNAEQKAYHARDQRLQHPSFNVPDYFGNRSHGVSPIGKFNYDPEIE